MKRALLIAGGTISGLGAVLAITPPELSTTTNTGSIGMAGGSTVPAASTTTAPAATQSATSTQSPTPAPTKSAAATKSATATPTKSAQATASATATATKTASPTPAATKATTSGVSGTYSGDAFSAGRYGTLTTKVTFTNGKISNVTASQSPSSWSQQSLSALIPYVESTKITVEQIKQYSANQLPCSLGNSCQSRASYTATAFWSSLKTAIAKANA